MKRLLEIQQELKAPKDQENPNVHYRFRNVEGILEAVKPMLAKHGLVLVMGDTLETCGGRVFLVAVVTLFDAETDKEITKTTSLAQHAAESRVMGEAQISGACSSYARKYALCGLFAIDDSSVDPDANEKHEDVTTTDLPDID